MLIKFPCRFLVQDNVDYEALGIPFPKPDIEVCDIYIFKDKISSFNEHSEEGLTTLRTIDGYTFAVVGDIKSIIKKLQENAE
jgi:hypothetical protein